MIEAAHRPCESARVVDWNDFRYFLAIARAGTFAGAARELGVEHTTVGRRLTALETALGTRLFIRGPEGLTPTCAGRDMLPLAEEIAARAQAIERRVSGDDSRIDGTVRVSVSEALSAYLIKQSAALRDRHPGLMVEMLIGNHASNLLRGEADLAVRARPVTEPDLVARKLVCAGWSLYASPDYVARKGTPPAPETLSGHDIITFDDSLASTPGGTWFGAHGGGSNVAMRGNSVVAVLNAAICGMGVAVLPCFLAGPEPRLQRLSPRILGDRDVYLVVHPDLARVARVRAVMDFIVELFERDAALWTGVSNVDPRGPRSSWS
jgi:DNA-binding transcriptional LysR family regulator